MNGNLSHHDVIILGAGAAGLMCAIEAGKRGCSVLVLDKAEKTAEKIRISGGGRCNFTNIHCGPGNFISENLHFCKSALARFKPADFIARIEAHHIKWHEKKLGQLFCDEKSQQVIDMLLDECKKADVQIRLKTEILQDDIPPHPPSPLRERVTELMPSGISEVGEELQTRHHYRIERSKDGFLLHTNSGDFSCAKLVIATGGPSIPKMGASGFAYDIAKQFGLNVIPPRPALVPLTFTDEMKEMTSALTGVSVDPITVACGKVSFREALLFTHRGLSGPAILQISSYWREGQEITLDLCPDLDAPAFLKEARMQEPKKMLHTILGEILPARLAEYLAQDMGLDTRIADLSDKKLRLVADRLHNWHVKPSGTEGYRTAEVTAGGVDTAELSSQSFETKSVPGLYFIGEGVDVTGHLGGHNFQWAWASGYCAGQAV